MQDRVATPEAFHSIFAALEECAINEPDHSAIKFHASPDDIKTITYSAFDRYTRQIAIYLREQLHLQAGERVAISVTRSIDTAVVIMGVMRAGLIAVPLETIRGTQLEEYKRHCAKASIIIADQNTSPLFSSDAKILLIDNEDVRQKMTAIETESIYYPLSQESPAYIEFSSGTSALKPKASLLTHGGLANLLSALRDEQYPQGTKIICVAAPTFDAFFYDFLVCWATTGTIHMTTESERFSPMTLPHIIRQENINFAVLLPDLLTKLPTDLPLEYITSMGEPAHADTFDRLLEVNPDRVIINGLGHTETGICLSLHRYRKGDQPDSVGRPIRNMQMIVLDENGILCPPDVPGQLYVAGPGLALEYVDNPTLTNEKFVYFRYLEGKQQYIPCEKDDQGAIRMWASGDLCCYHLSSDGLPSFRCIGRTDRNIKFHGVSLNIDGMETMIRQHDGVQNVAVVLSEDKERLVAFIIRVAHLKETDIHSARQQLSAFMQSSLLPPIAFPTFKFMKTLPNTRNGKVDYKTLTAMTKEMVMPGKKNENMLQIVTRIWKECTGLDQNTPVDTTKSLAELGVTSLIRTAFVTKINNALKLKEMFTLLSNKVSLEEIAENLSLLLLTRQNSDLKTHDAAHSQLSNMMFLNRAISKEMDSEKTGNPAKPLRKP